MNRKFALVAVFLFCASTRIFAQADTCNAVLGLRDISSVETSQKNVNAFRRHYCDHVSSSSGGSSETSASVGLPLAEEVEAAFGMKNNNRSYRENLRDVCEAVESNNFSDNKFSKAVQTIGKGVVDAWEKCINRLGLQAWLEAKYEDPTSVVIAARYVGDQHPYADVIGEGVIISPPDALFCRPRALGIDGKLGQASQYMNCLRRINDSVTITLHTTAGGKSLTAPSIRRECASTIDVVDTLYSQLFAATSAQGDGGEPPAANRNAWASTLRKNGNIQDVAKQMITDKNYAMWIINSSLVGSKNSQPQAKQPDHAYGWMANSMFTSLLGRYPTRDETGNFIGSMPSACSLANSVGNCLKSFKKFAEALIDGKEFDSLHRNRTVFFSGTEALPAKSARYCGVASDCITKWGWCESPRQ